MTSQVGPITSPNTTSCLKNMQNYFRYNYTSNFHFHQTTIFGVYAKNYQIWRKFDVVMTKVILLVFLRHGVLCCGEADNLEVLAIVLIMKKRFLQAEEVFRSALRFRADIC